MDGLVIILGVTMGMWILELWEFLRHRECSRCGNTHIRIVQPKLALTIYVCDACNYSWE